MKKMHITFVMCAVCLLINFKAIHAQKAHKTTTSEIQFTTIWDGTSWSNGKPNKSTKVIFAADFKATENIVAFDFEVLAGAKVIIEDNVSLSVINNLKVDPLGKLTLIENAQLLQNNPTSPSAAIDVVRLTGFINKFDYTYFSSPVANQQLNLIGDSSQFPFYTNTNGPGGVGYLPPISDRYYVFESNLPAQGTDTNIFNSGVWTSIPETTVMNTPGKGFIIRGPSSFPDVAPTQQWQVKFTGEPYTGTQTRQIYGIPYTPFSGALNPLASPPVFPYKPCENTLYTLNLIGNPYPAIISADSFLTLPANITNLDGAMYFWTHKNGPTAANGGNGTEVLNYTNNDYVVYNLVGGVGGSNRPTGIVPTCQGFVIRGITNSVATFTDDMKNNITGTDQMYRFNSSSLMPPVTKNRFWVSIEATGGANPPYRETLIGYMPPATAANDNILSSIPGSTNNFEKMYDVEVFKAVYNTYSNGANDLTNRFELYTLLNPTTSCPRLVIQGRKLDATFNVNDVVQLGYTCPAGTYKIKGFLPEGLFSTTQQFWLKETIGVNSTYHDIRNTPYTFTETAAVNDNTTRFQIVFKLPSLPFVTNNPPICGTLLTAIENSIFTNNVAGVNLFSFEVRDGAAFPNGNLIGAFPGNVNPLYPYIFNLNFSQINPDTTYWVRPASYQVDGQWVYGQTCQVTTPSATSFVISPACGTVVNSIWATIGAQARNNFFGNNATMYRFRAFDELGAPFGTTAERTVPNCQLANLGVTTANTNRTFTIRVDIEWRGAWRIGTTLCNITTANVITRQSEHDSSIFEASTYPNPFENNFKLDINTSSEEQIQISVYDMLGRQMESKIIQFADLDNQEIGANYASGVYNVILKQGENLKTLRVIKR